MFRARGCTRESEARYVPTPAMSTPPAASAPQSSVGCPFCGLLCDDLTVELAAGAPIVASRGCGKSRQLFALADDGPAGARVDGREATTEIALARAAEILRAASQPLLLTAGIDVAGMRALLELADRTGAVVDHANADAMFRNLLVLQDGGWISTTLTEVRNRADLLVSAGTDIVGRFPRFFERCFGDAQAMFVDGEREAWFLGAAPAGLPDSIARRATAIAVDRARLGEIFATLRALEAGKALGVAHVAGVPRERLEVLLARMRAARYGVLAWAAADLDFPHAELAIQGMCELVKALNAKGRFAALPLGGTDGDVTAMQVSTWQSGYPLRVSFAGGAPVFDPVRYRARRMLEAGEADAVLFVSALDPACAPPASDAPTIVLGRPGTRSQQAAVFVPLATPGIHHAGHLYRTDSVVAVRLRKLADTRHLSAARALSAILRAIGDGR
ncbi:MAG TPA: formylmethanofuran dehydrogenase [Burkholderiales bacterium]|nr:formylmethanofuran dehydrogenase [Burkholderiales bacterium]